MDVEAAAAASEDLGGQIEAPRVVPSRGFLRLLSLTCAATYLLIFVGGLVRVSGAGLGCPDWPRCFGGWVPPTDARNLPADLDPALFNVTLAWIEYVNRLIGVLIGFLILGCCVWALARYRSVKTILWPTVAATLLVGFQGWLGSVVVSSLLEPWIITAHLLLALLIISLLVWAAVETALLLTPPAPMRPPPWTARLLTILWLVSLLQIGMGTQIRGVLESLIDKTPLLSDRQLIAGAQPLAHLHLDLGLAVAVLTFVVAVRLVRTPGCSSLVTTASFASMALMSAQILIGFGFVLLGLPAMAQLLHAWIASLFVGALLVLWSGCRSQPSLA